MKGNGYDIAIWKLEGRTKKLETEKADCEFLLKHKQVLIAQGDCCSDLDERYNEVIQKITEAKSELRTLKLKNIMNDDEE